MLTATDIREFREKNDDDGKIVNGGFMVLEPIGAVPFTVVDAVLKLILSVFL